MRVRTGGTLTLCAALFAAAMIPGCAGRPPVPGDPAGGGRLERIVLDGARIGRIEGSGRARIENRLGEVEVEFTMVYEPGVALEFEGELAPGFLPFHGDVDILSTPDTTLAFVNGIPLVPDRESFPGRTLHAALIAIALGGDYVLGWLESEGCSVAEKTECAGIGFEFDLDEETGHVKAWTLAHENPDGTYDGFLYESRSQGPLELPQVLTGMANPFAVAVYVEYYEISATIE